jgi:hypothetical protein
MNFTSSDNSQDFITATATFNYGYYEAIKIWHLPRNVLLWWIRILTWGIIMTLDQMMEEWRLDATVDSTELGIASLKIPELHSKYLKIYF